MLRLPRLTAATVITASAAIALAACSLADGPAALSVGVCLGPIGQAAMLEGAPVIDCGEPHESEVYASFQLEDGEYPGGQAVAAEAERLCLEAFEEFVGIAYGDSELLITTMTPIEEAWERQDDREALCLVNDVGDTSGTLQNANR